MTQTLQPQENDHFRNPPSRRIGALGILRNSAGGVLMVERRPAQEGRRPWYHPGGCVEANECSRQGLVRAARFRLGVTLNPGRLLAVHHMLDEQHVEGGEPYLSKEGLNFLFDCGVLDLDPADLTFGPDIVSIRYLMPEEFGEYLPPYTAERTRAALRALAGGQVEYLEGHPDYR